MKRFTLSVLLLAALAYGSAAIVRNVATHCSERAQALQDGAQ